MAACMHFDIPIS